MCFPLARLCCLTVAKGVCVQKIEKLLADSSLSLSQSWVAVGAVVAVAVAVAVAVIVASVIALEVIDAL